MKSPIFSGTGHRGKWTLTEIIVRLGRRQVGAIAQQIAIINSLVRPEESAFDLRRFWQHSVGCAMIADRLYTRDLISLRAKIEFNEYWIGALLHDIGKLILGFFSWSWFEGVLKQRARDACSFRQAEAQLGETFNHEHIGRLLLLNMDMGPELAEAVGAHHSANKAPGPLVCLLYMADNLCKEMGLGYVPEEPSTYSAAVLKALRLEVADVQKLQSSMGDSMVEKIEELTDQCIRP